MVAQHGGLEPSAAKSWKTVVDQHIAEIESGKVKGVPLEEPLTRAISPGSLKVGQASCLSPSSKTPCQQVWLLSGQISPKKMMLQTLETGATPVLQFSQQTFGAANPHAIALALVGGRVRVVAQHVLEFGAGGGGLVFGGVKFRELHLGARIGMILRDVLPVEQRVVRLADSGERFRQRHHRVPVIVLRLFVHDAFEQRTRLGGTFQAQQALAEMRAGVNVVRIAFERGAVAFP